MEEKLKELIRKDADNLSFLSILTGNAFKNKGTQPFLDTVIDYIPSPLAFIVITGFIDDGEDTFRTSSGKEPFSALAFQVGNDPFVGTLTFNIVYSGVFETGTSVCDVVKGRNEHIRRMIEMYANETRLQKI